MFFLGHEMDKYIITMFWKCFKVHQKTLMVEKKIQRFKINQKANN